MREFQVAVEEGVNLDAVIRLFEQAGMTVKARFDSFRILIVEAVGVTASLIRTYAGVRSVELCGSRPR